MTFASARGDPWRLPTLAAGLLAGALVVASAARSPATFDEVSFLAALARYDLLSFEPHFPGYPFAVGLARLAAALGAEAPYAASSAFLALLAALRIQGVLGGARGALCASLSLLAPLAVREGARPMSDAAGTWLLAWALVELWRLHRSPHVRPAAWLGGAALLGAACAAKPDLLFFNSALAGALAARPAPERPAAVLAAGLGLAVPAALGVWALAAGCGGLGPATGEALRFGAGHLGDWGGGVASQHPGAGLRAARFFAALPPALGAMGGLGAAVLASTSLLLVLRAPRALRRAAVVGALPYALWVLFAQNLEHPRHLLPLLPLGCALLAHSSLLGRPSAPLGGALALALLLAAGSGSLRWATAQRARGRPLDAVEAWFAPRAAAGARLYAGGEARALRWRRPAWDVRRARSLADVRADLAADPDPPPAVWVAESVLGAEVLPRACEGVRRLRSPPADDPSPPRRGMAPRGDRDEAAGASGPRTATGAAPAAPQRSCKNCQIAAPSRQSR